jgi:hypothetical protein
VWCVRHEDGGCGARPETSPPVRVPEDAGGCGKVSVTAQAVDDYVTGLVVGTAERSNLSMVRAERHVKDSQRLIAEVAEDEQLLNDPRRRPGCSPVVAGRVDQYPWTDRSTAA